MRNRSEAAKKGWVTRRRGGLAKVAKKEAHTAHEMLMAGMLSKRQGGIVREMQTQTAPLPKSRQMSKKEIAEIQKRARVKLAVKKLGPGEKLSSHPYDEDHVMRRRRTR